LVELLQLLLVVLHLADVGKCHWVERWVWKDPLWARIWFQIICHHHQFINVFEFVRMLFDWAAWF
jgi:hypothetical protein